MMANIGATKVQMACVPLPEDSQQLNMEKIWSMLGNILHCSKGYKGEKKCST